MLESKNNEMMEMKPFEASIPKNHAPKRNWVKKGMAIMLSAALFGSASSAAFYGVGKL